MLTHKNGVVPRTRQHGRIGRASDARFGDTHHTSGHLWSHSHRPVCIDSKGHEVSLVHPDQVSSSGNCTVKFGFVVNFDKRIEPNGTRQLQERFELGLIESSRDQQHTVGPHDAGIAHIASTDREVLT